VTGAGEKKKRIIKVLKQIFFLEKVKFLLAVFWSRSF
jgi:hypothetical protein